MNTKQISGFVLLGSGVLIIFYALFASYGIFTGVNEPPGLFEDPVVKQSITGTSVELQNAEAQIQALLGQQLQNLLPENTVSKTLNLFAWSIFAGILMFGGTQLAMLGIKLLALKPRE